MAETLRRNFAEWMLGIILAIVLFLGISEVIRLIRVGGDSALLVEIQLIQDDGSVSAICAGSDFDILDTGKCDLVPGTYRVVANWISEHPATTGDVSTQLASNLFKVSP
jgi:hypothetical protein